MNKTYEIKCTGLVDVPESYEKHLNWQNEIVGFTLPDGSLVDLFIGFRVTKDGKETWLTEENKVAELGLTEFQYEETTFTEE